jgi:uncharacterized membrane protein
MDSHKRTITKAITWRLIAVTTAVLTVFFFTGNWRLSLGSGVTANILNTLLYYVHERAWNLISWGIKDKN